MLREAVHGVVLRGLSLRCGVAFGFAENDWPARLNRF